MMLGWSHSRAGSVHRFTGTGCRGSSPTSQLASGSRRSPCCAAGLTRSPAAVAAVTTVQGLPWLLLGGGAGVIVDRVDRRRLMVMVDTARAVLIAALAVAVLVHSAGLVLIYLTGFLEQGLGAAQYRRRDLRAPPDRAG